MKNRVVKRRTNELHGFKYFGGSPSGISHAKTARPLSFSRPIYVVLSSQMHLLRRLHSQKKISRMVALQARKNRMQIHDFRLSAKHIHFYVQVKTKKDWLKFIRTITGLIARFVLGAEKGQKAKSQLWKFRPWTLLAQKIKFVTKKYIPKHIPKKELRQILYALDMHSELLALNSS